MSIEINPRPNHGPAVLFLLALIAACASGPPYATFQRVALNGQTGQISLDNLAVVRGEELVEEIDQTVALEPGDRIETKASYGAVIGFLPGASLVMAPSTAVAFGESDLELVRGEVLFRPGGTLTRLRVGAMTVLPAGAALVKSDGGQQTQITALGGPVGVEAPQRPTARLDPASVMEAGGNEPITTSLSREQLNTIAVWANGIDEPNRRLTPDVTGLDREQAAQILSRAGMTATENAVPVEVHQIGIVQLQSPLPGTTGQALTMDVGAESVLVADVILLELDPARVRLNEGGNVAGDIAKQLSVKRDVPTVVGQTPKAGTRVLKGSSVAMVVEFPGSVVPTVYRLPAEAAMTKLTEAKLRGAIGGRSYFASVPEGSVAVVQPGADSLIDRGSEVRLVLSDGVLPAPAQYSPANQTVAAHDPRGVVSFNWAQRSGIEQYQMQLWHGEIMLGEEIVIGSSSALESRPRWREGDERVPYAWCVRGKMNGEWGEWSPRWTFEYEPPDINVPVLGGMQWADPGVQQTLQYLQVDHREEYCSDTPAGTILRCDRGGAFVAKPGDMLTIYVSKGRDPMAPFAMPEFGVNASASLVQNQLTNLGLTVQITEEYSDTVAQGREIRRSRPTGAMAKQGDVVEVVVSKGPDPTRPVAIPEFGTAADINIVRNELTKLGLIVQVTSEYSDTVPAGRETRRSRVSGASARPGETIECFVSLGPDPTKSGTFFGGVSKLGRGFNVTAEDPDNALRSQVLLFDLQTRQINPSYGSAAVMAVPLNLAVTTPDNRARSEKWVETSVENAMTKISASVGLSGSYKVASGEFNSRYGSVSQFDTSTAFVEYLVQSRVLIAEFDTNQALKLHPAVQAELDQLAASGPYSAQNAGAYEAFLRRFGTHYVRQVTLGARGAMYASVTNTERMDSMMFKAKVEGKVETLIASASAQASTSYSTSNFRSDFNANIKYQAKGGDDSIVAAGSQIDDQKWERWVQSIKNGQLAEIGLTLEPIWSLTSNGVVRAGLQNALNSQSIR